MDLFRQDDTKGLCAYPELNTSATQSKILIFSIGISPSLPYITHQGRDETCVTKTHLKAHLKKY